MPFTLSEEKPDDASAIAKIFLSNETDDFLRLQFGTVDPAIMNQGMIERLTENIKHSGQVYVIARNDATREIVSYASWMPPRKEGEPFVKKSDEDKVAATEAYRAKLLPGMNGPLLMDFREEIMNLQERVLGDKRCWMLGNLGTLPSHRGQGVGSSLTTWPFEKADIEGLPVYLETEEGGNAKRIYDRVGFKNVDKAVFDLSKYGGSGVHTHVAMIREPQTKD